MSSARSSSSSSAIEACSTCHSRKARSDSHVPCIKCTGCTELNTCPRCKDYSKAAWIALNRLARIRDARKLKGITKPTPLLRKKLPKTPTSWSVLKHSRGQTTEPMQHEPPMFLAVLNENLLEPEVVIEMGPPTTVATYSAPPSSATPARPAVGEEDISESASGTDSNAAWSEAEAALERTPTTASEEQGGGVKSSSTPRCSSR